MKKITTYFYFTSILILSSCGMRNYNTVIEKGEYNSDAVYTQLVFMSEFNDSIRLIVDDKVIFNSFVKTEASLGYAMSSPPIFFDSLENYMIYIEVGNNKKFSVDVVKGFNKIDFFLLKKDNRIIYHNQNYTLE